jgi:dTDP-4-dehydrorhamnose reductase
MAKALIVGVDSMIGAFVERQLLECGFEVYGTSRRHTDPRRLYLDLTEDLRNWEIPEGIDFACIFAGVTALRDCEVDPEGSWQVNVVGTSAVIEHLISRGIYVLFPSSNLVFDGSSKNITEDSKQSPRTEYGRQKLAVERLMTQYLDQGSIVRLTKVIPPQFDLFMKWKHDLAAGKTIRPFNDMWLAPISLKFTAQAIKSICEQRRTGIFHISGAQNISYTEAASYIAARIGADTELISPISGKEMAVDTDQMPRNAALSASRIESGVGLLCPNSFDAIKESLGL